jgi:proteasome lid subunit RPN8/RPN11
MIGMHEAHVNELIAHAQASRPNECCGMIGGLDGRSASVYQLRNAATSPATTYEAAPEDLFHAQRTMRERGEELLAIYHSHPRQADPTPSETDVRLAYYPDAIYLIIGLAGAEPRIGAFRLSAEKGSWETADLQILTANQSRT